MDEIALERFLMQAIEVASDVHADADEEFLPVVKIRPFYEANLLMRNRGLVITMQDGSEFLIPVVQSKLAEYP
jgi:hypothetical protein